MALSKKSIRKIKGPQARRIAHMAREAMSLSRRLNYIAAAVDSAEADSRVLERMNEERSRREARPSPPPSSGTPSPSALNDPLFEEYDGR